MGDYIATKQFASSVAEAERRSCAQGLTRPAHSCDISCDNLRYGTPSQRDGPEPQTSLRGQKGPPSSGPAGPAGATGATGAAGATGSQGPAGPAGQNAGQVGLFTPGSTCSVGQSGFDTSYIYVCVSANVWKKAAVQ